MNFLRILLFVLTFNALPHIINEAPCYAAGPVDELINRAIREQDDIYRSRGELVPEGYVIDRSLLSYTHTLSQTFDRALEALDKDHRWLDIGAGEGQAILDYFGPRFDAMHPLPNKRSRHKARAVALSIEDRRTARWPATASLLKTGQIQYLSGKRLREYPNGTLGRYNLITDVVGAFSYTRDLTLYMQIALNALEADGNLFTLLTDARPSVAKRRPFFETDTYLTEIIRPDGRSENVCNWLRQISCIEVICNEKSGWQPPVETFHLHKTCEITTVPPLTLTSFVAGTPPSRRFHSEQ